MDIETKLPFPETEFVTEPGLIECALSATNQRLVEVIEHMDNIIDFMPGDFDDDTPGPVVWQIREACLLELSRRFGSDDCALDLAKDALARSGRSGASSAPFLEVGHA